MTATARPQPALHDVARFLGYLLDDFTDFNVTGAGTEEKGGVGRHVYVRITSPLNGTRLLNLVDEAAVCDGTVEYFPKVLDNPSAQLTVTFRVPAEAIDQDRHGY